MGATTYLIPLQTAVDWTKAWRHENPTSIKAFRVDIQEIKEILAELDTNYVRIYFGLDGSTEKLVLVGVDANDKDIIDPTVDGFKISGTYDFNQPCPSTCDITSPLYNGRMPAGEEV